MSAQTTCIHIFCAIPHNNSKELLINIIRPFTSQLILQKLLISHELCFRFSNETNIILNIWVKQSNVAEVYQTANDYFTIRLTDINNNLPLSWSIHLLHPSKVRYENVTPLVAGIQHDFSLMLANDALSDNSIDEEASVTLAFYLHLAWIKQMTSDQPSALPLVKKMYEAPLQTGGEDLLHKKFAANKKDLTEIFNEVQDGQPGEPWLQSWRELCNRVISEKKQAGHDVISLKAEDTHIPLIIDRQLNITGNRKSLLYHFIANILPSPGSTVIETDIANNNGNAPNPVRELWLGYLHKLAAPVLTNLANGTLKQNMPVKVSDTSDDVRSRGEVAYLESFGRTLSGIAPWLNGNGGCEQEQILRNHYRTLALQALQTATNKNSSDYLGWNIAGQSLVDASYVALALIRCPWLWHNLDNNAKTAVINALSLTRSIVPVYTNWILFPGMIEAFFCKYGLPYDELRIEYGIREFSEHWYAGDGMFNDGMEFHMDYYNSIVIHPFLANILEAIGIRHNAYKGFSERLQTLNKRYAEILERHINPDGSYPPIGRSLSYRGGVFHHLADMALRRQLPASLPPAQVRGALTAVMNKTFAPENTFTKDGWLNIGLHGLQPGLADFYITTGSLYMSTNIFLPLGLEETAPFWSDEGMPWTSVKIWEGKDLPADRPLDP
jgi:hypothetical protein